MSHPALLVFIILFAMLVTAIILWYTCGPYCCPDERWRDYVAEDSFLSPRGGNSLLEPHRRPIFEYAMKPRELGPADFVGGPV